MSTGNEFQDEIESAVRRHRPAMARMTPPELLAQFMIEALELFERMDFRKRRVELDKLRTKRKRPDPPTSGQN